MVDFYILVHRSQNNEIFADSYTMYDLTSTIIGSNRR